MRAVILSTCRRNQKTRVIWCGACRKWARRQNIDRDKVKNGEIAQAYTRVPDLDSQITPSASATTAGEATSLSDSEPQQAGLLVCERVNYMGMTEPFPWTIMEEQGDDKSSQDAGTHNNMMLDTNRYPPLYGLLGISSSSLFYSIATKGVFALHLVNAKTVY